MANDVCTCRFLRARKFDVTKAKELLLAGEQWRKDFGVDALVACVRLHLVPILTPNLARARRNFEFKEKAEVDKYYPQFYHKTDKVRVYLARLRGK
jgi:hypothetical protein